MNNRLVSLYFHIPFCSRKCDYCHFYVIPNKDPYKKQFMEGLKLEWRRWQSELEDKKICSIYFGGGTPTLLGPDNIEEILRWIRESTLCTTPNLEVTLEANPEDISSSLVRSFAAIGVNRLSIGIQSLDDQLLKEISRQHSAHTARDAVITASQNGIPNISVDLMYDLPRQTLTSWEKTLDEAVNLPITHLSLYNLVLEPQTVFFKKKDEIKEFLPDALTSQRMYESAIDTLEKHGWTQYEVSAFQKDGLSSRHNVGYWTARPFLGFGPSAFSYWKGKRFRNVADLSRYSRVLKEGLSPVDFEEELPEVDKKRELLAINLRMLEGVDMGEFARRHGDLDRETATKLQELVQQGLLSWSDNKLKLTRRGLLLYDAVATEII
ncbi:MAG: Oxygen-independent coproporphyrinogen-III oxidase-like protein YqeR [Chlamydiae bacterium]|nr:Oxygen-independent coproporphyrinogen-III oxidase-like protein YqeR [Chlamydiota bacterium]